MQRVLKVVAMTKSYLILALVLGLVLIQTCSVKAAPGKQPVSKDADADEDDQDAVSDDDADSEDDEEADSDEEDEEEEEENEDNPAPSCLLYGDQACHVECSVIAQAYDVDAEGYCDPNNTCQCHISGDVSFHERWDKKFDSDYVYHKINENDMVLEQAHRIFNFPLRTAQQFKELFKPIISPYQFSRLKTHDESMAAKFTEKGMDKVDTEAVQKYVSEKVAKLVKSSAKSLLTTKYKDNFKKALESSEGEKGTLYNLTFRLRQLKVKALDDIMKEYLKKNELEEPQVEANDDKCLAVILTNAITNEIIKLTDEKSKALVAKKKAPPAKKAPAKAAAKPKSAPKKA